MRRLSLEEFYALRDDQHDRVLLRKGFLRPGSRKRRLGGAKGRARKEHRPISMPEGPADFNLRRMKGLVLKIEASRNPMRIREMMTELSDRLQRSVGMGGQIERARDVKSEDIKSDRLYDIKQIQKEEKKVELMVIASMKGRPHAEIAEALQRALAPLIRQKKAAKEKIKVAKDRVDTRPYGAAMYLNQARVLILTKFELATKYGQAKQARDYLSIYRDFRGPHG